MAAPPLIAIVDDDLSFREALAALMRSCGFTTAVYDSGDAVLDSHRLDRFSLFLLDVQMPGMSGLDLHRRIRSLGHEQPIIFLTGGRDAHLRGAIAALGARYVPKPFDPDELLDTVQSVLEP